MATTLQSADSAATSIPQPEQLKVLLHDSAIAALDSAGWIRVTGADRVRWLNGMVTNAIQTLAPGDGCYNFVLNAQGRIQGDLTAWKREDSILLQTDREQVPALLAHIDKFIIMDDVELADVSDQRAGILVAGRNALRVVGELDGGGACSAVPPSSQSLGQMNLSQTEYRGTPVDIIQVFSPLVPRYEIWGERAAIAQVFAELASIPRADHEVIEQLRILEGTPRYGVDIRDTATAHDLPQETAQTRALHFSKGCYLGQEIVERIRSRGNVHRTFSGFLLSGAMPAGGTTLAAEGKPVGELTSVAAIPLATGLIQLALGYIRREVLDRKLTLEYPGGTATSVALPYQLG